MIIIKAKTLEEVKNETSYYGYYMLDEEYLGDKYKYNFTDKSGFKYYCLISTIKKGSKPRIVSVHNPYSIENIILWCKLNNRNFKLKSEKFINVNDKLEWKCLDNNCKSIFFTEWRSIYINGTGCPYCSGKKVNSNNCLATLNPELTRQWHPTKNGELTPYDVTCGNGLKVWWLCKDNPQHEWDAKIQNRAINETGCPYCSGRMPTDEKNLTITNPDLVKEWHDKNILNPNEVMRGTNKKVWWKCSKDNEHEWKASVRNRAVLDRGCPFCSESKGEKRIRTWLEENNIKFISQKEFDGLIGTGNGNLSYDIHLPNYNLLIEYQGEFHDGSTGSYSRLNLSTQQEHDKRKREFAKQNNIELLEIWYWDFDNIEKIFESKLI